MVSEAEPMKKLIAFILSLINQKPKAETMNKITINLSDAVKAGVNITLSVDADGNITATGQKVLTDTTTGDSANDGSPFAITLEAADQTALEEAISGVLTPIVQAQLVPPATS